MSLNNLAGRVAFLDVSLKAIARGAIGYDMPGILRIRFQLSPELPDHHA